MNATTINIGKSNTSVNVVSGILNASCFMLYSGNNFNPLNTTCWLDTIPRSTGVTQLGIGVTNADEIYIGDGVSNKKVVISTRPNTNSEITIGNASSTISVGGKMTIPTWGNLLTPTIDSVDGNGELYIGWNSADVIHIGNPSAPKRISINGPIYSDSGYTTTVSTKFTVDGSAVDSNTNIMTIKQNTGSYLSVTDFVEDPFCIRSPNSGTLSVNNSLYDNLTMGMGVDTTYNCGYIGAGMYNAVRPIVIGGRGGDTYIGYLPTGIDKTAFHSGGNLWVKGLITSGSGVKMGGGKYITCFDAGTATMDGTIGVNVTFSTTFPTVPKISLQPFYQDDTHVTIATVTQASTTGFRIGAFVLTGYFSGAGGVGISTNSGVSIYWTAISHS